MADNAERVAPRIKYRRSSTVHPGFYPGWDYLVEVDGKPFAQVMADQASRQSGTTSRWYARDLQGERITSIHGTFRRLKEDVAHYVAGLDALQNYGAQHNDGS